MSAFDTEDLKTEINTILDKPESSMETENASSTQNTPQKSILKAQTTPKDVQVKKELSFLDQSFQSDFIPRPHTLEDFVKKENLIENRELTSTFKLDELDEDEEIWVLEIPKTIDPTQLKGLTLQLDDKSKFKIGEERYCTINRDSKSSLTCIFNTDDNFKYETVNIKPARTIGMRRKLSGMSKKKIEYEKPEAVPFPQNIKVRHPFFGVQIEDQVKVKSEKKC